MDLSGPWLERRGSVESNEVGMPLRIRTLTAFLQPGDPIQFDRLRDAARALTELRQAMTEAGIEVQTLRLATPPMATWVEAGDRTLTAICSI